MAIHVSRPTPHHDVNTVVDLLHGTVQAILGDHFIAFYLGGSLALGDFDRHRSDIDFVIVTRDELSSEEVAALEHMHAHLRADGGTWAMRLDGGYIPQQVLRRWGRDCTPCPFVEADTFFITHQGSAVIQRSLLRQHGVVVAGPPPDTLIDPVSSDELRMAVQDMLEKWWRPLLDNPGWVQQRQKQPFAILTLCRALYTLEHGAIVSKPVAAHWVQQSTGEQWATLLAWALTPERDMEADNLEALLHLICYTLKRCKAYEVLAS